MINRTQAPPARRRTAMVLGVVGIAAVLAVGGVATIRGLTAEPAVTSESMTFDVQTPRLVVDVGSGDVTVGRTDSDRVEVIRTVRSRGAAEPRFTETSTADGVALSAECDGAFFGGCSVDYEVRVPDGFDLDLRSNSGRVAATDLEVASARLLASSGDLHLAGVRGPVELETSAGEVSGERLEATTLHATTSSGDVRLDFAAVPSSVDVDVNSGEVSLALPPEGPYQVQVDTGSGEKAVSVPVDAGASSAVRVGTSSGDIDVHPR